MKRLLIALWIVAWAGHAFAEDARDSQIPTALQDYVARKEPVFDWKLKNKSKLETGNLYDIALTSQTWQGIVWKHILHIYEPKQMRHRRHVLLFVTGGNNGSRPTRESVQLGLKLAQLASARVATLFYVPNQPLLGGRREDDLITETWLRYLKTGDAKWPLLFPMVKSAVKAMDAVEEIAKSEWKQPVAGFVITGASKRGWTSWLTPVADKRILATAPIVIDVLNFQPQMRHQLDVWGKYSEQIIDYTSKGLVKLKDESPREIQLRRMMDPYTYRKRLKLPKLMIIGTNDRYWVVDALNLYWDGLVGSKHVLYVPNVGHGLKGRREFALTTIAVFFQHIASGKKFPQLVWKHSDKGNNLQLTVTSSPSPQTFKLWTAHAESKDFRNAKWQAKPVTAQNGTYLVQVSKAQTGHVALFGEAVYQFGPVEFSLSTQIRRE